MNELNNKKLAEEWEKIGFTNDFIFCKVMQNEHRCKVLLERLLGIRIDKIEYTDVQKTFASKIGAKSIRLDVYLKGSDKVFDLEMQTTTSKALAKRARYYQALMGHGYAG